MEDMGERNDGVVVRDLRPEDLEAVTAVDARCVGRRREDYLRLKLRETLKETGIRASLAAEADGCFCGFLLARVYYGEFGVLEPVTVLDTIDVDPDFRGRGVGAALLRQLRMNLSALGVARLRTEVGWEELGLLNFFHHEGFRPAPRLCLELDLGAPP
ncbi:MAG: GNAT family N-acetyltransferase [Acidobacteriota bacterium]